MQRRDDIPTLTIAVPTYNGAKTIRNMLDLLLPQCDDEIEIIISDNCSTDNTSEIISEYLDKYTQIRYIRNQKNIGPDANFLQCMKEAKGKFTWLVSDDDVVIEGAVRKILEFLHEYPNVSLLYASTVDFRGKYEGIDKCSVHRPQLVNDLCTKNKNEFIKYAGAYWGFMSSFICNTENFKAIKNPERFFGTYWLQSYVHALCASDKDAQLGLVKGPCIGAGIYVNTANFDSSLINGIYYKKMLEFMIKYSNFEKKPLDKLFAWRICHLSRHDIIKEKASGIHKLDKKRLFKCTNRYITAWTTVYPLFLLPDFVCEFAMGLYRKHKKIDGRIIINRPE